jgi:hypothetical protein
MYDSVSSNERERDKEEEMVTVFMRHRVADFAKWKPAFDEHEADRRRAGFTAHTLYREADDPNTLIVAFTVADLNRAKEFAASEDLRSTMVRAGVQGPPEVWFVESVEEKRYQ